MRDIIIIIIIGLFFTYLLLPNKVDLPKDKPALENAKTLDSIR